MEEWNKKLAIAGQLGDIEALKLSLQNGADIEYQDEYGQTALMSAAERGHLEICRLLIDRGCKIDITHGRGWTALMKAAGEGHLEICRFLIDTGCKIDITEAYGGTALMFAAGEGHLEICRLLIDTGCKIDITHEGGVTALMFAANGGHLEICRLLIDTGCKIDITSVYGQTALMRAARGGHLEICRLLIDRGCKIDITSTRDGETALHYAAGRGYLQTTRCLVEQGGANPLIKTHEGKTPYDLAAAEQKRQYKEVMEYLQSVMSEKYSGVTAGQGIKGDMVPTEIRLMADKRSIDLYLKLLESGSEKKRDIRLVVVGKKGAGKTSLIRRLFGEDITDVNSTNGIEIHKIKCKAMSDDGVWNKLDGHNEDTEVHARLRKHLHEKLQDSETIEKPVEPIITIKKSKQATSFDESKKLKTVSQQPKLITSQKAKEPLVTSKQSNPSTEQAKRDFEKMRTAKVDLHDKEEYATLLLWDFGGDEEFYHTHQTFLSADAIYLVVTNLIEADDKEAQELFKLWMDSVHCYSRLEDDKHSSDETKPSDDINPPVVIVGTWKDAVKFKTENLDNACKQNLLKYTKQLSKDARRHLRDNCEYFISNKDDEDSVFKQIREDILTLARKLDTWNNKYPLKFIKLEQRLQEEKTKLPIISYKEIREMSLKTPMALSEQELKLFLEFHHALRTLVFFADLKEYIVLDTQWLSDAFKCIVTAKKFHATTKNQELWDKFFETGKLNEEVLEDIFKNQTIILYEHKDHILNVMEKFDIIIRPNRSEGANDIYVPCMIKKEPKDDIYKMLNVTKDINTRSTWLCFKFSFLPPHLINHLIASLNRKYTVAEVVDHEKEERQIVLFKGTAVFELQHETTKLRKLLVMARQHVIQIQVWEFGEEIKSGLYKYIADFVTDELSRIMHSRFKMSNVKFEKTWECGLTKPKSVTGSNEFMKEAITEYRCDTCQDTHNFIGEWSNQQDEAPRPPQSLDAATELTPDKEGATQTDIILEIPYNSFEPASGLTSDIEGTTGTNIIPEKQPMNLEVATRLTSNKDGIPQTNIIPENPLKSYESASGFKSDTESTSLTQIISKKEPMSPDTKVDFSYILDQMMTKLVISVDDRRTIEQNTDPEKKLFSIIIDRGEPNKSVCIDVLKQNSGYEDLTEKLSGSPSSVPPPTKTDLEDVPAYKIRLQKNYLKIIETLKHNQ